MMEYKEFSAKTVSDCITDACTTFGVPSDRLDYQVVSEGSAGFMGFGAKAAVINARIKEEQAEEAPAKAPEVKEEVKKEEPKKEVKAEVLPEKKEEKKETVAENKAKPAKEFSEEEINKMKADAEKFLKDVFASMKMEVNVDCKYSLLDGTLNVDLSGAEMGVLIGKRGQTLDSLQYLTSLVVNKGTAEYIRVKVDTENYRQRRKETLENLAKNIAFKVKRTRRPVSLEPMNPYERRIIHSALQNDRYVTTHSEGEEPFRKVVVTLKR